MGPVVDPVASDSTLPQRASVVIIGGGIIGTSAALFLAKKGVSVVLCEKGHVAGEQSSRNWGWVRKMNRDPRELPLIIESLRLWEGMNEMVEAETGFRRAGILYVCDTDEDMAKREAWLDYARPYQLDTRLVGPDELSKLLPGATRRYKGAAFTASDGRAEPQKAAPAIAAAARRHGATILTQCAVRGLETAGGRVAAVITEKGRIPCDSIVLAGGAWSRLFCRELGLRLPQLKVLMPPGPRNSRSASGSTAATPSPTAIPMSPTSCRTVSVSSASSYRHSAWNGARCASASVAASLRKGSKGGASRSTSPRPTRRCGCSIRRR